MKLQSNEFRVKVTENKNKIQNAIAQVLTNEWQKYDDFHHFVNLAMGKDARGRQIDLEFITLNDALKIFDKTTPLEWKKENEGKHIIKSKLFLRLKGNR